MKITKDQLKKLIEQELKEVQFAAPFGTTPRFTSSERSAVKQQFAPAAEEREKKELAMADTTKLEPVSRDPVARTTPLGPLQSMSNIVRRVYTKVSLPSDSITLTTEEAIAVRDLMRAHLGIE